MFFVFIIYSCDETANSILSISNRWVSYLILNYCAFVQCEILTSKLHPNERLDIKFWRYFAHILAIWTFYLLRPIHGVNGPCFKNVLGLYIPVFVIAPNHLYSIEKVGVAITWTIFECKTTHKIVVWVGCRNLLRWDEFITPNANNVNVYILVHHLINNQCNR